MKRVVPAVFFLLASATGALHARAEAPVSPSGTGVTIDSGTRLTLATRRAEIETVLTRLADEATLLMRVPGNGLPVEGDAPVRTGAGESIAWIGALEHPEANPYSTQDEFPRPQDDAARSLSQLRRQVLQGKDSLAAPAALCRNTATNLCLLGRFVVVGVWENQYLAPGVINVAGATQLTTASGYLWFFSPVIMEVPIKMVNFCFEFPQSFGVFAAGLSDFGVGVGVRDMLTGIQINYINDPGDAFNTIIDKAREWPCV